MAISFGQRQQILPGMTHDLLSGLILFAFVSSVTPGPNNLMLMASGANFGFRRSIPHMLGVALGFVFMVLLMGAGLAQVFDTWPLAHVALKFVSIIYMLWLAWKIANAAPIKARETQGSPMTFVQAAAFQWVNPKAWAMAITAITAYTPGQTLGAVAMVGIGFTLIWVRRRLLP